MFSLEETTTLVELEEQLKKSSVQHNFKSIQLAFEFAEKIHGQRSRKSGKSEMVHLLTVASYVNQLGLDDTSIIAALLHEALDVDPQLLGEIDSQFGTEVAFIVNGITDMKEHTGVFNAHNEDPDNFRKLMLNSVDDIRILLIRLTNKLHNIQSLDALSPERRTNQANKTLLVYAPICEYIGLGYFQSLFENMAFKALQPEDATFISNYVSELQAARQNQLEDLQQELQTYLQEYNAKPQNISFRTKNIYSIYKKVNRKYRLPGEELTIDHLKQVKDILAMRIITNSVEECYLALGLIHGKWPYLSEEFDDYIVRPKESGYRSVHTVIDYEGVPIEIQIRTQEMHDFNEFGPASHIAYKLQGKKPQKWQSVEWTKDLTRWQQGPDSVENKEVFKVKAFANSIFVFTPKGKVIRLDKGSTPLDFAFMIHTDLGSKYLGARINGKQKPMTTELHTGDIIEIQTTKKVNVNRDWLKFAQMQSTKSKIRKYLREPVIKSS